MNSQRSNLILSNHRCGSSFFANGIAKLSNTIRLSEPLAGVKHWGWMSLDENNRLVLDPTKKFNPVHPSVEVYRRLNNHHLKLMNETVTPFTAKLHIDHLWSSNINLIEDLLQKCTVFALYREDVEDALLSKHFLMYGNQAYDSRKHLQELRYSLRTHEGLHHLIRTRQFDHVIRYEDLEGNVNDFKPYFAQVDESIVLPSKRMSKEEKINALQNYEDFKRDFDRERPEYGV